ncbi:endolytic transglycosylase MltG [Salinactinospora qingdaonensis]|uniref:Endolytic murein transglycosylase n=1 Tax=Salinactinospora qingdaonensis TaxID=702744 RepID=A0ABP7FSI4_9ACTN
MSYDNYQGQEGVSRRSRRRQDTGAGATAEERDADPLTDPWQRESSRASRGRRARPSQEAYHSPTDSEELREARPRGRRHRPEATPDPETGWNEALNQQAGPLPDAEPRGRRHRRSAETVESTSVTESFPSEDAGPRRRRRRPTDTDPGDSAPAAQASSRNTAAAPVAEPPHSTDDPAPPFDLPFETDDESGWLDGAGEDSEDDRPRRRSRSRGAREVSDEDDEPPRRDRKRRSAAGAGRRSTASRKSRRAVRKRRRNRGAGIVAVLVLLLIVGGGGTAGFTVLRTYVFPPDYDGEGEGSVKIVVEEGFTGTQIGQALKDEGVVASVRAFTNAIRGENSADFEPGTYELRLRMSAEAAVDMLLDPASRMGEQITIREGLRASEIMEQLAEESGVPLEEFEAAYEDPAALGLPDYAEQGAEGYLFPDTYAFDASADATQILTRMVDRYKQVAEEIELGKRAEQQGYTVNEIMAMAAIIQAESGSVADMPKVARVIYNRLDEGMMLQMDSTCFYALGEYGIALNDEQQQRCEASDSEYKTYFRQGLPVGPIVSPGKSAIEAALQPADGDWLYFVTTDPENGVTKFAETETKFWDLVEEFNQNQQAQ